MKMNLMKNKIQKTTHEGGKASAHITAEQQLRRSVMACLLWEDTFYEDGKSIADRIVEEAQKVSIKTLSSLTIETRTQMNLRHVPLLLLSVLCRVGSGSSLVSDTIYQTIQRADELSEFCVVYAKVNGTTPDKLKKKLSAQAKKGLARAFTKFSAEQLAKYNRDSLVKLRDVLFLCHAKPKDTKQAETFKLLSSNQLPSPDTWEVNLSAGKDKKEVFTRLLKEKKLGYMALLKNLRNMTSVNVDIDLIKQSLFAENTGRERILPFRFVAAARACPQLEPALDIVMTKSIDSLPLLKGKTVVLVDVSGSMDSSLSGKSDLTRIDAACALASIINAENLRVFSFSNNLVEVPPRKGMSGIDAIRRSQHHSGTQLGKALEELHTKCQYDRIIIITDEQTRDTIPNPKGKGYIINVATNQNGIGYGAYTKIDGFSENVLKYIYELENSNDSNNR
jgi:60 kDa SS-A/Ro ribonucleoprotein